MKVRPVLPLLFAGVLSAAWPAGSPGQTLSPLDWRPHDHWACFWVPRWVEGLTVPPHLALSEDRGGVQRRAVYDPALNRIVVSLTQRDVALAPEMFHTPETYAGEAFRIQLARQWEEETRKTLTGTGVDTRGARPRGGLVLEAPVKLPGFAEKIFGDGAPNLRVSGDERITIGGTSSWKVNELQTEGFRRSKFPSLEMRQQLNVRLNGTIGDKLHIDINQNSEASTSLENQIRIYYQGHEDDVVQRVDLGNTNLSLPRTTQNISLSTRQEGLFGVKMTGRFADWDFAWIASKQEGANGSATFSGGSQETDIGGAEKKIYDADYARRKYFFIFDPDTDSTAIRLGLRRAPKVFGGDLVVYLYSGDTQGDRRAGRELKPCIVSLNGEGRRETPSEDQEFYKLQPNEEYAFVPSTTSDYPYLVMKNSISEDAWLAVSYQYRHPDNEDQVIGYVGNFFKPGGADADSLELKLIRPGRELINQDDLTLSPWAPALRLEQKNIYYLGARNIERTSLRLSIRRDEGLRAESLDGIPYLQVLGLDLLNNDNGQAGPDGRIDEGYLDYDEGILRFPDLRPFDPTLIDLEGAGPGLRAPSRDDVPRVRALGFRSVEAFSSTLNRPWRRYFEVSADSAAQERNPLIYDRRNVQTEYKKYYIEGSFKAFATDINLGQYGILENSETVRMDGRVLQRNVDYTISYDTGQIRLLSSDLNPNGNLQVTYSYTSFLSRGDKSLVGFSTTYGGSSNWDFSTTLLYESKGVPERRPRLRQEPSRTILGDVSGSIRTQPWFLTEVTDALPLIRTNAPSRLALTGSMGLSLPNPNTKGDVYVDDMEGIAQTTSASMARETWKFSSLPAGLTPPLQDQHRLGGVWFSIQREIQARDLSPRLDVLEGDDFISGLGLILLPNPIAGDAGWFGLTQHLADKGLDLREAQYMEIWFNDFNRFHGANGFDGTGKELRISLGQLSEDAVWDPKTPPRCANGGTKPDTEDRNLDGQRSFDEDLGLDTLDVAGERNPPQTCFPSQAPPAADSLDACPVATENDPEGDDFSFDSGGDEYEGTVRDRICRFRHVNGTERNNRLDSEDLDGNNDLYTDNNYFEFVFPLNSDDFTIIDVQRDYPNYPEGRDPENGWRLLRIPLNHPSIRKIGEPSFDTIKQMRIWFKGFADTTEFQIASVEIVGNRWERQAIRFENEKDVPDSVAFAQGKVFNVAVVNNKQNADVYAPPFPVRKVERVPEREQALALAFENLGPGEQVSAFNPLYTDEDFTIYQSLSYYVRRRQDIPADDLEFFLRFSSTVNSDVTNAYEISMRLDKTDQWQTIDVPLTELSRLKIGVPDSLLALSTRVNAEADLPGNLRVKIYGKPSFSQVRRLQAGVRNRGSLPVARGEVWFNELRLGQVRRDAGVAAAGSVDLALGDFATLRTSVTERGADFLQLGSSRGGGVTNRTLSFSSSVNVDRFFPAMNLVMPLSFGTRRNTSIPKFRARDDIIFDGLDSGFDITRSSGDDVQISARRQSSPGTPWFVRHTVDALSVNFRYNRDFNFQTTRVDSSWSASGQASYGLRLGNWLAVPLPRRLRFTPLPNISLSYAAGSSNRISYNRDLRNSRNLILNNRTVTRNGNLQFQSDFHPLPQVTYALSSQRDLVKEHFAIYRTPEGDSRPPLRILGLDVGREIARSEQVTASQTFSLTDFFRPRITWSGNYREDHAPSVSRLTDIDGGAVPDLKNFSNGNTTSVDLTLPVSRIFRKLQGGFDTQRRRGPANTGARPPAPPARIPPRKDSPPGAPADSLNRGPSPGPPSPPGTADSAAATVPPPAGAAVDSASADVPAPGVTAPDSMAALPGGAAAVEPGPVAGAETPSGKPVEPGKSRKKPPRRSGIGRSSEEERQPEEEEEDEAAPQEKPEPEKKEPEEKQPAPPASRQEPAQEKPVEAGAPARNPFRVLGDLISLGDIRTRFGLTNSTSVTRVSGSPPPAFRLGLTSDFGDVERADNTTATKTNGANADASSTVSVLKDITVDATFRWNESETDNNRSVNRTASTTWPSLRFNLAALERKLNLKRFFNTFTATSNFERRTETRGTGTNPRESESVSNAWHPFLQFDAGLKNGWRTTFSTDRTSTESSTNSTGGVQSGVVNNRSNQAYRMGLSKSLGVNRGSGSGRTRTTVDLTVDMSYTRESNVIDYPAGPSVRNRTDNFQSRFSTSYRFTSTVSGSMQLTLGQTRNLENRDTQRSIGLHGTASISF